MEYQEIIDMLKGAQIEIDPEISKSGLPCLWEAGGGYTNTGSAEVICDKYGKPKRAIYIPTRGHLCNVGHALIPVVAGDMYIEARQQRGDYEIRVWQVIRIEDEKATLELVEYTKSRRADEAPIYSDAVMAAMAKASHYHCRSVYYAR